MKHIAKNEYRRFFFRYLFLFTLLFISLAVMAFLRVISVESNPFFYANF